MTMDSQSTKTKILSNEVPIHTRKENGFVLNPILGLLAQKSEEAGKGGSTEPMQVDLGSSLGAREDADVGASREDPETPFPGNAKTRPLTRFATSRDPHPRPQLP